MTTSLSKREQEVCALRRLEARVLEYQRARRSDAPGALAKCAHTWAAVELALDELRVFRAL